MEQLIRGADQHGMRPVVDFHGPFRMPREDNVEVGRDTECTVDDLRGQGGVDTADRTAAELGVERGCCPSVVMRDPMKHAGRDLSCGGYHLVELTRLAPASTEIGAVGRHVIP